MKQSSHVNTCTTCTDMSGHIYITCKAHATHYIKFLFPKLISTAGRVLSCGQVRWPVVCQTLVHRELVPPMRCHEPAAHGTAAPGEPLPEGRGQPVHHRSPGQYPMHNHHRAKPGGPARLAPPCSAPVPGQSPCTATTRQVKPLPEGRGPPVRTAGNGTQAGELLSMHPLHWQITSLLECAVYRKRLKLGR